jgi:hypothetical protein
VDCNQIGEPPYRIERFLFYEEQRVRKEGRSSEQNRRKKKSVIKKA